MSYMQFPNINTAFPEGVPGSLPTTKEGVDAFGARLVAAMQGLRDALYQYGPVGQIVHNAFMLNGLMADGYASVDHGYLWQDTYEAMTPIWRQIYDAHANSDWETIRKYGFLPPTFPLDPLELPIVATYWPNSGWLTETQAQTAAQVQPLPQPGSYVPAPAPQTLGPDPRPMAPAAETTILGFPLWQVGLAAVGLLIFMNSK